MRHNKDLELYFLEGIFTWLLGIWILGLSLFNIISFHLWVLGVSCIVVGLFLNLHCLYLQYLYIKKKKKK